jgi:hypothetical protein
MTAITAPIFENAEEFIKGEIKDLQVDGVSSVWKTKVHPDFSVTYAHEEDEGEEPVEITKTLADHVTALEKMVQLITNKELFVGGVRNPIDLTDPCNWDVEVVDAYFQLVALGEVIYS